MAAGSVEIQGWNVHTCKRCEQHCPIYIQGEPRTITVPGRFVNSPRVEVEYPRLGVECLDKAAKRAVRDDQRKRKIALRLAGKDDKLPGSKGGKKYRWGRPGRWAKG